MKYTKCKFCFGRIIPFNSKFELVKCNSCRLIFYEYMMESSDVKKLYHKLYNEQVDYAHFKIQALQLKNGKQPRLGFDKKAILRRLLKMNVSKIVEIGAGVGIVGFYLNHENKHYSGIELDSVAAKLANDAGVPVVNGSFEELRKFQNVDAVLAFEVLEHIDKLQLCLQNVHESLVLGGLLGFTVPNFNRIYNLTQVKRLTSLGQVAPPVHINFFTVDSLKRILALMGFEVQFLKVRSFPSLQWKRKATYKKLWNAINGKFYGSTIYCIAKKV